MKASRKGRVRPTILFSQTPHSVARRAKRLSNRTAAELLRHLCELTIGFGRGSIDLTYRALAEALHKDWSTIARAAKLLREMGDVEAETLDDGSYRWYVLLEPEDIVADPEGVYRVRGADQVAPRPMPPHGENAMGVMAKMPWGHGENAMGDMAKTPWGHGVDEQPAKPLFMPDETASKELENTALKIDLKDTSLKIHHQEQSDDEAFDHKKLLGKLMALGTGQRVARKLLREHDHELIASALERVRHRADLDNPAGYLIREVEDGGYEKDAALAVKPSDSVSRETPKLSNQPPMNGCERTKAEFAALEAQKARQEMAYRHEVQGLIQRFQGLPEDLRVELKSRLKPYLETLIPNTPKKAMLMEDQRFQKIAFKEVTAHFFALLDEGLSANLALAQLAA